MKDFIQSVKFKILVGILALLVGIMLYAATTGGETSAVSSFVGVIISPVQKLSSSISNKVSTTLDMLMNAEKYYDENQILREKLDEQYNKMVDYENIKEENLQYEEILGMKQTFTDYEFSPPCRVIGRPPSDMYQSFFIDKGSKDGISLQDPVVTSGGLVGKISDVQLTYSTVTTVLSPEFQIGVYCIETKAFGSLEGDLKSAKDSLVCMKYINRESEIKIGDVVVTSGYSGIVPKDRVVGTVEEVSPDESGLMLVAKIKPVVNISDLKNCFVITDFEGQGVGYVE